MKKNYFIISIFFMLCLLINISIADEGSIETYRPNQKFDLGVNLFNSTGNVVGANCSIQIRRENYSIVVDSVMNEIGQGWYNFTYNSSELGYFVCRQNCTTPGGAYSSETCDFFIGDTKMGSIIGIVMIMIFIIAYYIFIISKMTYFETFNQHGGLKLLFFLGNFWILLIPMNFAIYLTESFVGSPPLARVLITFYQFMIGANLIITVYFIFYFIKRMAEKIGGA